MLKEVFRTVPLPFLPTQTAVWSIFGMVVNPPYLVPEEGKHQSILLHGVVNISTYQGAAFAAWRLHSKTGQVIETYKDPFTGSFGARHSFMSRSGKYWTTDWANGWLAEYKYGNITQTQPGDDKPKKGEPFFAYTGTVIPHTFWTDPVGGNSGIEFMNAVSTAMGIDDKVAGGGLLISGSGTFLYLHNWTTGRRLYEISLPQQAVAIALEDDSRCYVLLENRTLLLVDYVRGEILGGAKIPPLDGGLAYGAGAGLDAIFQGTRLTWDATNRRMLLVEIYDPLKVFVRGFRIVPEPIRVTTPIPLKVPRHGRVVPVLVQVRDDMNQGIGGYKVEAVVSGSGSLVGVPITDYKGDAIVNVACEGSEFFMPSPLTDYWETTGSPEAESPHLGLIHVDASVRVYPVPLAISGVEGGAPGGEPGPPGSGGAGTERYIWSWTDMTSGAPPPDAPGDQAGAPQSMAEWEAYFFTTISRAKGTPANDFNAVLMGLVDQGAKVNPAPDEVPQVSWPFYGIAIMVSGGEARGRIWLPTAVSYSSGGHTWWTHEIQVIADDPTIPAGNESGPNMFYIVDRVKKSKQWDLSVANKDGQLGRAAFVKECVMGMHDVDAKYGFIDNDAEKAGYSYQSVGFKNPDGVTIEHFIIVTDTGGITWIFDGRDGPVDQWFYAGH